MTEEATESEMEWLENEKIHKILQQNLDKIDYRIYKELNANGRISDTELGNRVGLSRTAARRRRQNLEEEGIVDVLGVLVLQRAKMAYADVRIRFRSDANSTDIKDFITDLTENEQVYEVNEYMGKFDLLVRVWHASLSDIKGYLRENFQQSEVVDIYEATPITKTIKAWHKKFEDIGEEETTEA